MYTVEHPSGLFFKKRTCQPEGCFDKNVLQGVRQKLMNHSRKFDTLEGETARFRRSDQNGVGGRHRQSGVVADDAERLFRDATNGRATVEATPNRANGFERWICAPDTPAPLGVVQFPLEQTHWIRKATCLASGTVASFASRLTRSQ